MESHYLPLLRVTKGSTDGSIKQNDIVYYSDDGSLMFIRNLDTDESGGWLEKDELTPDVTDFEYEIVDDFVVYVDRHGCEFIIKKTELKEDGKKTYEIRA
jgi:hypothetical protein